MSVILLPAEKAQYSAIIDGILATGDLQTISAKQIRKALGEQLGIDLTDKKSAVQELILERFDRASQTANNIPVPSTETATPPTSNGNHVKVEKVKPEPTPSSEESSRGISTPATKTEDSDADSELVDDSPPKKRRKQAKPVDDAKLAAMLQAQENSRARPTRGGANKKAPMRKKPKKKSEKKIKKDEDSELELDSNGEVKEKVKKGGFHKQYHLSAHLADLVGEPTLSRPQVVKKLWVYIKANELQDPSDKRQIICDEKMQLVFKQDKVHMFTMNKIIGNQLYPIEEE
ncbi:hypothetical protein BGZ60DRAFT_424698 [Tricladium varicosporioides]|nr:hypothetical protein BGZ60DRAFT_424698 [Hymenoscyphus varicosporioides]